MQYLKHPKILIMLYTYLENLLNRLSSECYFRTHWKLYCPGCGGTRALLALMHGDLLLSLKYNPVTLLFLLNVLATIILSLIKKKKGKYPTSKIRLILDITLLIFIIVFSVLRNYLLYAGIDVLGDFS